MQKSERRISRSNHFDLRCMFQSEEKIGCAAYKGVISWTTLITGYAQHKLCDEALGFRLMQEDSLS